MSIHGVGGARGVLATTVPAQRRGYAGVCEIYNWPRNSVFDMTINDPFAGTGLGDDQNIDWTTVSVWLPSAGTYTLGFEIQDSIGAFESILGVDDVSVVPTPGAFLLGAIGCPSSGA